MEVTKFTHLLSSKTRDMQVLVEVSNEDALDYYGHNTNVRFDEKSSIDVAIYMAEEAFEDEFEWVELVKTEGFKDVDSIS